MTLAVQKAESMGNLIVLAGVPLLADCAGALYWPEQNLLAVADLHLEKGSSFAARGQLLPPYDSAATLARLGNEDRANLRALQRGRDWLWLTGNHDPDPANNIGGTFQRTLTVNALTFRHQPSGADREIAGHLHPVARVAHRGRAVSRRCFAADATRMVMPAFGAFTGGLNIRDAAFAEAFGTIKFTAHMLGEGRLYAFTAKRCLPD
jgi:metallophosphoesterase superfamily enzyme